MFNDEIMEKENKKVFYNEIPKEITKVFDITYSSASKRLLFIIDSDLTHKINSIEQLYYKDGIFYITSKLYMLVFWVDIQKWEIIKRV